MWYNVIDGDVYAFSRADMTGNTDWLFDEVIITEPIYDRYEEPLYGYNGHVYRK